MVDRTVEPQHVQAVPVHHLPAKLFPPRVRAHVSMEEWLLHNRRCTVCSARFRVLCAQPTK